MGKRLENSLEKGAFLSMFLGLVSLGSIFCYEIPKTPDIVEKFKTANYNIVQEGNLKSNKDKLYEIKTILRNRPNPISQEFQRAYVEYKTQRKDWDRRFIYSLTASGGFFGFGIILNDLHKEKRKYNRGSKK